MILGLAGGTGRWFGGGGGGGRAGDVECLYVCVLRCMGAVGVWCGVVCCGVAVCYCVVLLCCDVMWCGWCGWCGRCGWCVLCLCVKVRV